MCFSATASFTVAAVLVPKGAITLTRAARLGRGWVALGVYPLAFAAQQAVEGVLWQALDSGDAATAAIAARGFVVVSHFFWLFWVPLSVALIEPVRWRRRAQLGLGSLGAVFGLSMVLPILWHEDWLSVAVVGGSLDYRTVLIYDGHVGRDVLRGLYAGVILGALLLSSNPRIRLFGGAILASLIATFALYPLTFISVWCFFAAVLSALLLWLVTWERRMQQARHR